jgi:glycosyltransferase involved in cell wall biosynthesis
MLENHNIICFAPTDWWSMNPSCTTHLMKRLARNNKVLYINPFSSDLLGVKKGIWKRIPRKIASIAKFVRKVENNLFVFSPVFLPLQGRYIVDKLNNISLKAQIKIVCRLIGMTKPVLWIENPRAADMLDWFDSQIIVYHVSDLFAESRYIDNKQKLREREKAVTDKSDLVICVSRSLFELKSDQKDNVVYLPHGVDVDLFRQADENNVCLEEVAGIPKPIVGYFGTMSASNDIDLLFFCASQLPEVSFVLAGKVTGGGYSELATLPNVYLLGKMPYEKIPALCACFDVCMLQWKMTEWIRCCNPLKLMEYMASGRPIVSVPIQEVVDKYSDLVSVAYSKEEFCKAIVWELQNDTDERSNLRVDIAREHSWDNHVRDISKWILTTIRQKTEQSLEDVQAVR